MYKYTLSFGLCFLLCFSSINAYAANDYLKISGFLSTAATYGDNEVYTQYQHNIDTEEFALAAHDNRIGIQLDATITDYMRVTTQLLARAPDNDFNLVVNWAYVDFEIAKRFNAHVGKYKIAQFLVSDYAEVGYAYPWIRPPPDVYGTNTMVSLSGLDMFFRQPLGNIDLVLQVYYGDGIQDDFIPAKYYDEQPPANTIGLNKGDPLSFESKNTTGINLGVSSEHFTFRIGHMQTEINADLPSTAIRGSEGKFSGVGFSVNMKNFISYAEYVVRNSDEEMNKIFPDQIAWYVTLGYRFGSFLPHYTFSILDKGKDQSDYALEQQSSTYGIRYEINQGAALKFEILHAIPKEGNYGLFNDIIEDAILYSLGMDFIF